jgi:hypothetical protein
VLQLRLLQQRLLVFQVSTLPIPPVTNKTKLATSKIRKTEKKLPHIYQRKSILQKTKSYHRHPTAKRTNSKLKKIKK